MIVETRRKVRWLLHSLSPKRLVALQERVALAELRLQRLEKSLGVGDVLHDRVLWFDELLTPTPSGHSFVRVGTQTDGGYVLAMDVPAPEAVLSIGVGSETSADNDLADMGMPVFQFDHTVPRAPYSSSRRGIAFARLGLGGDNAQFPLVTLKELAARTGATGDLWLMLDAEGAEWPMLRSRTTTLSRYSQIAIELHGLLFALNGPAFDAFQEALSALLKDHVLVSRHDNEGAPILSLGGVRLPDVTELTLIRKDVFVPGEALPSAELFERPPVDLITREVLSYRSLIPQTMRE
jgi:hypothetical protein